LNHIHCTRQAFFRLLLALGAVVAAVQLFRLLLLPVIQSLVQPGDEVTSGLRRSGIFFAALVAYWAYVRLIEKRPVTELRLAPAPIAVGAASGALLISLAMLALYVIDAYEVVAWRGLQGGLAGTACVVGIAAMLEEIVFRGIIFRILEQAWGTLPALWLASALFALMHYANLEPDISNLAIITSMVAGTLIGAFWTLVFVLSRKSRRLELRDHPERCALVGLGELAEPGAVSDHGARARLVDRRRLRTRGLDFRHRDVLAWPIRHAAMDPQARA